jgi:hypothetical protein
MRKKILYLISFFFITALAFGQETEVMADWDGTDLTMNGSFGNGSFGDSLFAVVANPNPSGINTSANVQSWEKASDAQSWGGFYYDLPEPLDLTGEAGEVCLKIHGDHAFTVRLKIEQSSTEGPDLSFDLEYTTPGEWQELCYDLFGVDADGGIQLASGHEYNRVTIFPEYGNVPDENAIYYIDDIVKTTGSPGFFGAETAVIADWDGTDLDMVQSFSNGSFGDSLFAVVPNPNPSGINTSANVQSWEKASDANTWAGFAYNLPEPLDLTGAAGQVCLKVHGERAMRVRFKLEDSTTEGPEVSFDLEYTTPGEWQELCYDLMGEDTNGEFGLASGHVYTRIVIFPERNAVPEENSIYYIDDIIKTTGGLAVPPSIISDYEDDGVTVPMGGSFGNGSYGDSLFTVIPNPGPDDVNPSAMVQEWCKASDAQTWGGFYLDIDTLDFTGTLATVCVSMWADEEMTLRLKVEGSATGPDISLDQDYTTPGAWQELCFDFTVPDPENGNVGLGHLYERITIFPNFDAVPSENSCYYIDNLYEVTNGGGSVLKLLGNVIQESPDHTILTELINSLDLWGSFNINDVTVFAPIDAAFNALPADQLQALRDNVDNITYNYLLYHIAKGVVTSDMLMVDDHYIMQNGMDGIVTGAGEFSNAAVTLPDVEGINGVLHVTDAILQFPEEPDEIIIADWETDDTSPEWTVFNGGPNTVFEILANPAPDDVNNSATVASFVKDSVGQVWQGMYYDAERPLNLFGNMAQVCMDFWAPAAGQVRLKLEKGLTDPRTPGYIYENDVAEGWNNVCWDMSGADDILGEDLSNNIFTRLTLIFDFPVENATLPDKPTAYYIDNIRQVRLASTGTNHINKLEDFKYYPNPVTNMLMIESRTPINSAIVFDISGRQLLNVQDPVARNIDVSGLQKGMYFVNFLGNSGELLGTIKVIKQ